MIIITIYQLDDNYLDVVTDYCLDDDVCDLVEEELHELVNSMDSSVLLSNANNERINAIKLTPRIARQLHGEITYARREFGIANLRELKADLNDGRNDYISITF